MNLSLKNKNPPQTAINLAKQGVQSKLTKKKACIIRLQVSKLLKPELSNYNFNKNKKIQQFHSHQSSQVINQSRKSLEKQTGTKNETRVTKSFEQLYFQKIKERKLQQAAFIRLSNIDQRVDLVQRNKTNSCKNIVSLKAKNQQFFPSSTKNLQSEENKQNALNNIKEQNNHVLRADKFFKKNIKTSQTNKIYDCNLSKSVQKVGKEVVSQTDNNQLHTQTLSQKKKQKKILKIKKNNKIQPKQTIQTKSLNHSKHHLSKQQEDELQLDKIGQLQKIQAAKLHQDPLLISLNSQQNPSAELKTFQLSTPSSSGEKKSPNSFTSNRFDQIIHSKINHSAHQHIWDGVQCFFSFNEFSFILQDLCFKDTLHTKEITFYVQKLWEHLGGDLYGGVVRKNMRQFLNLVLQDDNDLNSQVAQALTSKSELSLEQNFIDKASLKLISIDKTKKDQIRKFYFPFRITKIASQINYLHIKQNSGDKIHNSINSNESLRKNKKEFSSEKIGSTRSNIGQPKQIFLQNNAYFDTISIKNRNQDVSPCMIPIAYDPSNEISFVTDFSPKMNEEKFEPFKSTVLCKDVLNEKLSTEQQGDFETEKKHETKPLLSVDVNLGEGVLEKLLVYEGQNPYEISVRLKERYNIDEQLREKFQRMLRNHLNSLLFKIEQVSEQLFEDSVELKDEGNLKVFCSQ